MRSGCAPSACNSADGPLLSWVTRAIGLATIGHFLWEAAQVPLYTLWRTGTRREIAFALIHCTGGDILITTVTLAAATALARVFGWRAFGWRMVFHRDCPWRRLYRVQRMAECRDPAELVVCRVDAGCSFSWHRPNAFAAMADCSRPVTCHHWLPIPPGPPADAPRGPDLTLRRSCAMRDSTVFDLRRYVPAS